MITTANEPAYSQYAADPPDRKDDPIAAMNRALKHLRDGHTGLAIIVLEGIIKRATEGEAKP